MAVSGFVTRFLDSADVVYSIDHHGACFTAQDLAQEEAITGYRVAKSVVCIVDDRPVIAVLPAPFQVDLDTLREEYGASAVRLAEPQELSSLFSEFDTALAPPPLPLWRGIPILADVSLELEGDIIFAAGSAKDAIRMAVADWTRVAEPFFGSFAMPVDG